MPAKRKVSNIISLPAPIGGWNVRDPLPNMEPQYAPILDNCFCLPSEIQVRKGWEEWATFTGTCETIMDYDSASGDELLLAAVNDGGSCAIYDVTNPGPASTVVTGLTSAQFRHCHFATSGGFFSYYVNNTDSAILYDGTTWQTVTNASAPYAIIGPSNTHFLDVISHKRRLWFVQDNALEAWYLPTDQIAGAAVKYDFAPIFSKGGHIVKIDTWSLDAGQGLDDYFVVFTTEGEVAVYSGTDPASMSTWQTVTNASAPYAIIGPSNTHFLDVISHKRRLWFVQDNALEAWYLPTDQIAGAAVKYDFAPIFSKGGHIVKIDTWSLDAGQGLDDYFVVFTTEGEVAVYSGTDPASMSTWQLTGVFYIGTPTGTVGHTCKYGGDLLIVNKDGIAQMSKSLMSSRVNTWLQMTDKIQPQLAQDTTTYQYLKGWDLLLFPPANMLIVNVPIENGQAYQYVMNTISGGWARWTGIPAQCWYYANENLWVGMDGKIGQAWVTQNDNGAVITANILPAYQNYGIESQLKRWTLGRVILGSTADVAYGAKMEIDFNLSPNTVSLPIVIQSPVSVYGDGTYGESIYGGNIVIKRRWQNLSGMGYWGACHIQIESQYSDIRLYSYDIMVESGGNL